jgi:nitrous oxide reductase accessory protein NosL
LYSARPFISLTLILLLTMILAGCRKATPPSGEATPHSVEVNWVSPAQPVTYYEVFRSTHSGIYDMTKPYAPRVEGTHFVDTNVVAGETYFYRIRAVREDTMGVEKSVFSEEVIASVPTR